MNNLRLLKNAVLLSASFAIAGFYFVIDPVGKAMGAPCLIHAFTGWKCWGCGGQRAFHQMMHGNISEAFRFNALIFPVVMLFGYIVIAELSQKPQPYHFLQKRSVQVSTLLFVAGFTILRNVANL